MLRTTLVALVALSLSACGGSADVVTEPEPETPAVEEPAAEEPAEEAVDEGAVDEEAIEGEAAEGEAAEGEATETVPVKTDVGGEMKRPSALPSGAMKRPGTKPETTATTPSGVTIKSTAEEKDEPAPGTMTRPAGK